MPRVTLDLTDTLGQEEIEYQLSEPSGMFGKGIQFFRLVVADCLEINAK